jgi:molybdate transport system substrate-binding protein
MKHRRAWEGFVIKFISSGMLCLVAMSSAGFSAEVKLLSVGTVSPVLHDLIPAYERQSGNKVQITFGNPAVTMERLSKGDPADVVLVAGALWDQAEKLGRLKPETKTIILRRPTLWA